MKIRFNTSWVKAASIRAVKTMAQTALSILTVGYTGILEVDFIALISAVALSGLLSVLTSLTGLPEVDTEEY